MGILTKPSVFGEKVGYIYILYIIYICDIFLFVAQVSINLDKQGIYSYSG